MTLLIVPLPEIGPAEASCFVDAAAGILDLPIDPAHRDSVVQNFTLLVGHARLVMSFALDTAIEAAPVFQV